jgi:hypothetical protein
VYEQISPTFAAMAQTAIPDETRSSIDFYRRWDQIDLLLPVGGVALGRQPRVFGACHPAVDPSLALTLNVADPLPVTRVPFRCIRYELDSDVALAGKPTQREVAPDRRQVEQLGDIDVEQGLRRPERRS